MAKSFQIIFDNNRIKNHFLPKYLCNKWTIKALLEFYGFRDVDLMLAKLWCFAYHPERKRIYSDFIKLEDDLKEYHNMDMMYIKYENEEKFIGSIKEMIEKGSPVYTFGTGYHLPYHNKFKDKLTEFEARKAENELKELENGTLMDISGGHALLVSGYDSERKLFHVSDLYHSEVKPHIGWIEEEYLLKSLNSLFLGDLKSTILKISYEKENQIFKDDDIVKAIKRNIETMLGIEMYEDSYVGITGMRKFEEDFSVFLEYDKGEIINLENQLFHDFNDLIMQREAHTGFLISSQKYLKKDFKSIIDIFDLNYHKYCRVRNLLLKGSLSDPYKMLIAARKTLIEIISSEEEALRILRKKICV